MWQFFQRVGFFRSMVVENVSSVNNIPLTNNFVLPAKDANSSAQNYRQSTQGYVSSSRPVVDNMSVPQEISAPVQAQKKGNKDVLWWVLGGLAVAGTAGVLIYNLRKGRATSGGANGLDLGDFAKKFADQSILTKTLERAQADGSKIQVQANADKSVIAVCDEVKGFGAQIATKFENNAAGKLSEFDFATTGLSLNITNFGNKMTHIDFGINDATGFLVKVDSQTGKVVQEVDEAVECMKFLMPRTQKLVDDLDPKKLLDDDTYRTSYVSQVHQAFREALMDYNYDRIATASGKSIDEVKAVANSNEIRGLAASKAWFKGVEEVFGLSQSPFASSIAKSIKDGDGVPSLLEKLVKGEINCTVKANQTVDGFGVIPKKNCFQIDLDIPDVPAETIKISDDGEFFTFTRGDRRIDKPEDFFEMELFQPMNYDNDACGYTRLTSKDASFSYKENADGIFDMRVSIDGKNVDVTDDVLESFRDEEIMSAFLKEFVTKGKESIVGLFS